jgi:hypothetical protein
MNQTEGARDRPSGFLHHTRQRIGLQGFKSFTNEPEGNRTLGRQVHPPRILNRVERPHGTRYGDRYGNEDLAIGGLLKEPQRVTELLPSLT